MAIQHQNGWFPPIQTIDMAQKLAQKGSQVAYLFAGVTFIFAITLNPLSSGERSMLSYWFFANASLFLFIGWKISHMSRWAALAGFGLHTANRVMLISLGVIPDITACVSITLISVTFINSIRGTFAYHRFRQAP